MKSDFQKVRFGTIKSWCNQGVWFPQKCHMEPNWMMYDGRIELALSFQAFGLMIVKNLKKSMMS